MLLQTPVARRYALEARLGAGETGSVFLATDLVGGQSVALKLAASQGAREEIRTEFSLLSQLRHPHLPEVFEFGRDVHLERDYFTMEWVQGETLDRAAARLGPQAAGELLLQACRALIYLHDAGWVHGDIKPANLLVELVSSGEPRLVLVDFGYARSVEAGHDGEIVGTPRYSAPAILAGEPGTSSSDVYALGAAFLEAFTGTIPGRPDLEEPAPPGEVSEEIEQVLLRMVASDEDTRYADPRRVLRDLVPILGEVERFPGGQVVEARFCGREAELARVARAVQGLHSGKARETVLAFLGERGVGKTRFLEEVGSRSLLEGVRVCSLRCSDAAAPLVWVPELLGQLAVGVEADLRQDGEQVAAIVPSLADGSTESYLTAERDFFARLLRILRRNARDRPWVCLVDDVDQLDASSLRFFELLARGPMQGLLFVLTAGALPWGEQQLDEFSGLDAARLERVSLAEARRIAASIFDMGLPDRTLLRRIAEVSEGHPHFAEVGARAMAQAWWRDPRRDLDELLLESLPSSLGDALAAEMALLDGEPHRLAAALAVLGTEVDVAFLEAVLGESEPWVERNLGSLARRGLVRLGVRRDRRGYVLRSEAVTRAVLARLNEEELRGLHRRACSAWSRREDADQNAEQIARHALACDWHDMAHEFGRRALRGLVARHVPDRSLSLAREMQKGSDGSPSWVEEYRGDAHLQLGEPAHALAAFDAASPEAAEDRLRLMRKRCVALEASGEAVRAREELLGGLDAFGQAAAPPELAEACGLLAKIEFRGGRSGEAKSWIERGLQALGPEAAGAEAASLWTNLGVIAFEEGDYELARATYHKALTLRESSGDREGKSRLLVNLGNVALVEGDYLQARRHYMRALAAKRRLGNRASEALTLANLSLLEGWLGRFAKAIRGMEEALETRVSLGDRNGEVHCRRNLAELWLDKGRLQEAWKQARRARELATEIGDQGAAKIGALMTSCRIETTLGWLPEALASAEEGLALARSVDNRADGAMLHVWKGRLLAFLGRRAEGMEEVEVGWAQIAEVRDPRLEVRATLVRGELELESQDLAAAAGDAQRALEIARRLGTPLYQAEARLLRGAAALGAGAWAETARELHLARELAEELGVGELRWKVYAWLAELHWCQGRGHRAGLWMGQVLEVFREALQGWEGTEFERRYLEAPQRQGLLAKLNARFRS